MPNLSYRHKNPLESSVIESILCQADPYYIAIKNSVETAKEGQVLAEQALELCDVLAGGQNKLDDVTEFVRGMCQIATTAHQDVRQMIGQFREIRVNLFAVCSPLCALAFATCSGSVRLVRVSQSCPTFSWSSKGTNRKALVGILPLEAG